MSEHYTIENQPAAVENEEQRGDPTAAPLIYAAIVGCVATLATILAVMAFFYQIQKNEMQAKAWAARAPELMQLRSEQEGILHAPPRWVDPNNKNVVGVPIDVAMKLVIKEWGPTGSTQPAPGGR